MRPRLSIAAVVLTGLLLLVAGAVARTFASSGVAPGAPSAIPGYWLLQRLGTPSSLFVFMSQDAGWGVANDVAYRTTNGGANWNVWRFGSSLGGGRTITDLFFLTDSTGWASGRRAAGNLFFNGPFVARTTDGGATWGDLIGESEANAHWGTATWVHFVDNLHGWIGGNAARTTDGGATWTWLSGWPSRPLRFIDTTTGFGLQGTTLMRTTDAGTSWQTVGSLPAWTQATWVGSGGSVMWTVGMGGQIARSTNGGASWNPVVSPTTQNLTQVAFSDDLNGWAAGAGGAVVRTTNGGLNWALSDAGTSQVVTDLAVAPGNQAWIYAGELRRTFDGGANWSPMPMVRSQGLNGIRMGSATNGWAAGGDPYLLGTSGGGSSWTDSAPAAGNVTTVDAVDANRSWALSASLLQRTTDAGTTWNNLTLPAGSAYDVDFVNANDGWLVMDSRIFHTTNGGQNWTLQYTSPYRPLRVSFADTQRGWVIGIGTNNFQRLWLKTTNGGASWSESTENAGPLSGANQDLVFVDANRGWYITEYQGADLDYGAINRTTDGGISWQTVRTYETAEAYEDYRGIDFVDANEGWAVGADGLIVRTTDGGLNWQKMIHPTRIGLNAVHAQAPGSAWMAGDNGMILRYSATQPPGCWLTPTPAAPYAGVPPSAGTITRAVSHCMDDTYIRVDTNSNLYDFNYVRMGAREGGTVPYVDGWLFRDVRVPAGSEITAAHIELQPWGYQSGTPIVVEIAAESRSRPADFSSLNEFAHVRPRTAAHVSWTIPGTASGATSSPDISAVIQEVVNLPGWQPGKAVAILASATGASQQFVDWRAYDFEPANAARLIVHYEPSALRRTFLPLILRR